MATWLSQIKSFFGLSANRSEQDWRPETIHRNVVNTMHEVSEVKNIAAATNVKLDDLNKKINIESLETATKLLQNVLVKEASENPVIAKLFVNMQKNEDFFKRLNENTKSKEIIQKNILSTEKVKDSLKETSDKDNLYKKDNIFIESGTTLAHVATSLLSTDGLKRIRGKGGTIDFPDIKIATNNAIVHIIMLFEKGVDSTILEGKPVNQYAATYGDKKNPNICNPKKVKDFLHDEERIGTMFTTASFLDINYGTHVSSQENCLMKKTCNEFIRNSNGKCSDIFVITSENIHDHISEAHKLKSDHGSVKVEKCRLTCADPSKTVFDLKDSELELCKTNFESYINDCDVTIITGSHDHKDCLRAVNLIRNKFEGVFDYKLFPYVDDESKREGGCIAEIYKRK